MAAAAGPGKCFLVTGPPGVGKTTLIIRAFEALKASNPSLKLQGFYTREIRQGSDRVGFEVVTLDGRKAPLASTTISRFFFFLLLLLQTQNQNPIFTKAQPLKANKYLDWLRLEFINEYLYIYILVVWQSTVYEVANCGEVREDTDLFIIDEVGKMELYSSSFFPAVLKILESNIPVLASVPIPKSGRDIPGVARLKNHPGATIFTLTTSNRDAVKDQIYSQLVDLLNKPQNRLP
ncbi:hypothetical protein FEM48_Zijuj08G0078100 [Ziziphus jujuba var. spinosa]|uniref:Uncharacterized protein n=1 Tax=Ziziphus jujuba var. spinosa TaxID=714518 RepID=A0A978UXV7_ZIZJJ|nr:hypothetical protein FEM48_Zijuj08G0078100 [Ziziphus jujuba var. spinosa]